MKVFVTQLRREVVLDELMADNPIVPQDPSEIETEWALLQAEPASGGDGTRRRHRNQGSLDPTTRSVVRRMEMFVYTGAYDPVTHEALCGDGTCTAPSAGEVGDFVSAQMTAANVQADTLTVSKTGNGNVESSDKRISCGNKCVMPYVGKRQRLLWMDRRMCSGRCGFLYADRHGRCGGAGRLRHSHALVGRRRWRRWRWRRQPAPGNRSGHALGQDGRRQGPHRQHVVCGDQLRQDVLGQPPGQHEHHARGHAGARLHVRQLVRRLHDHRTGLHHQGHRRDLGAGEPQEVARGERAQRASRAPAVAPKALRRDLAAALAEAETERAGEAARERACRGVRGAKPSDPMSAAAR
jgi:hypothetical protein